MLATGRARADRICSSGTSRGTAASLRDWLRELPRRLPGAPEPESSDPETERFLLFSAVSGALVELAASMPVCLVLDDLHWADAQSVALLKHVVVLRRLVRAPGDRRFPRLGPRQGSSAERGAGRICGASRASSGSRSKGFGATEVSEVMAAAAGHELDADGLVLAEEIASETDGNPFFVGEVLRSLVESGRLLYDSATERWSVDRSEPLGLPESVRDVIGRRVERLGDEAREVLTLAAVIGRSFELALLARLAETTESELLDRLEAAVTASLLDESTERLGRFRFVHALINQTLYDGLGADPPLEHAPPRRARARGAEPDERVAELALHWRLAATDNAEGGACTRRVAGRLALDSLAPAEAAKLFADALDLLGPVEDAERCAALIGLGEAQQLTGDPAYRQTLLQAAQIASALGDADLAAAAALANTRGFTSLIGDLDDERVEAIERAARARRPLRRRGGARSCWRSSRRSCSTSTTAPGGKRSRPRRSRSRGTSAIRRVRARVLQHAFHGLWSPDKVAVRADLAHDLLASAQAAEDRALEFWANLLLLHVGFETGDFARAQVADATACRSSRRRSRSRR